VVPAAIALYAAYWAFSVRKALAGRMYRRHAFLLGVVCVVVAIIGFVTYSPNQTINYLIAAFYSGVFVFLFAFFDSTVPLARRSDPLLRSVLRWDKLRVALWIDTGALAVLNVLFQGAYSGPTSSLGAALADILWPTLAIILFGASGAALFIGARRSRDPFFQTSLKWLGLVLIVVMLQFVVDTSLSFLVPNLTNFTYYYSYYALPSGFLSIVYTYFMYRSARSLAPMSSLADSDLGPLPQVGAA